MKTSQTPNNTTLDALRKLDAPRLETLIENAKEALKTLEMDEWTASVYKMLIANAQTVLAEKKKGGVQ